MCLDFVILPRDRLLPKVRCMLRGVTTGCPADIGVIPVAASDTGRRKSFRVEVFNNHKVLAFHEGCFLGPPLEDDGRVLPNTDTAPRPENIVKLPLWAAFIHVLRKRKQHRLPPQPFKFGPVFLARVPPPQKCKLHTRGLARVGTWVTLQVTSAWTFTSDRPMVCVMRPVSVKGRVSRGSACVSST
jgi:hypothetical protein